MQTSRPNPAVLALALLAGCTGSSVEYTLNLVPVVAPNQAPFDGLGSLELTVESADGDAVYDLSGTTGSPTVEGLGAVQDASLAIRGYANSALQSFGRTPPVTLENGALEVPVLFAEVDAVAELQPLTENRFGASLAPSADGRFYLFGGSKKPAFGSSTANAKLGSATIYEISLASPDPSAELTFVEVGAMPEHTAGGETGAGRVDGTATLLTGDHDDAGKILVTGGSLEQQEFATITDHAFLFDPATGEIEEVGPMTSSRAGHLAVENALGEILLMGGLVQDEQGALAEAPSVEIYRPESRSFEEISANGFGSDVVPLYGMAASLGEDGVLYCGGFDTEGTAGFTWTPSELCFVISNTGSVTETEPMESPVINATLTPLGDGQALLAGGQAPGGFTDQGANVEGVTDAWLYDHNISPKWKPVSDMGVGRLRHGAAPLGEGRALIIGGAAEGWLWPGYDEDVTNCVEIFDIETYAFTYAGGDSGCAAGLPQATTAPSVASHPLYGVMIAGGDDDGADGVSAWLTGP